MAEVKKDVPDVMKKLAMIADAVQDIYSGKATIVFELEKKEYKKMISMFREIDRHHKQFKIEISGTEFIYLLNEPEKVEEKVTEDES
jgi:hypothetical protein